MTQLWAFFLIGFAFGGAARWGRFCLLRGLRQRLGLDAQEPHGSTPALQAFALALAIALVTTQSLAWSAQIDLSQAPLVRSSFSPIGVFIGGALFGLGMVLARACGARSLVLLAGGNLRSLVTLVFLALGAQAAMTGALAPMRQWLQSLASITASHASLPALLQAQAYPPVVTITLAVVAPALLLAGYALYRPALRRSPAQWISAVVIGFLVAVGWWVSTHVGVDPFVPAKLASLSFVGPVAETLLYLQLAVGRDWSLGPALATGVLLGAFCVAILSRTARWEGFDSTPRLVSSALGGLLMGLGGVVAAGCSIGQGLTGLSTLALASFPAAAGIVLGALLVLRVAPRS